jgi:DHA3 family macrolide efflux protein-like MFS transporter
MTKRKTLSELRTFLTIWFGQLISLAGSRMTSFALGVLVYEQTKSATKFALISLSASLPAILIAPFAGALVDRWDRRKTLIFSDFGASLCTLTLAFLLFTQRLQIWHIYIAAAFQAAFSAFQWPAYSAAVTLLVPKRQLGRVSGLVQFSEATAQTIAPLIAGVLILSVNIWGVLLVDYATFLFAVSMLLLIRIPRPAPLDDAVVDKRSLWREAAYGWSYITTRRGLFGLLIFFASTNFLTGMAIALFTPLILSFASPAVLGMVLSTAGAGMLVGSLVMSMWGGPTRRAYGVIGFELLAGICTIIGGLRPSARLIAFTTFVFSLCLPIVLGCSQAIWQSKVAPGVQGRVFAVRRMIAWSTLPLAYAVAGPLADRVFNPLLTVGGPLSGTVGRVIGVGPGRGIGMLFIVLGLCVCLTALAGYLYHPLRMVEEELPDALPDEVPAMAL